MWIESHLYLHQKKQPIWEKCPSGWHCLPVHFVSAQSLSGVQLFETPWTVACQALLSMRLLQARILEWVVLFYSRRIFLTQKQNLRLLHWQAYYLTLHHLGSHTNMF